MRDYQYFSLPFPFPDSIPTSTSLPWRSLISCLVGHCQKWICQFHHLGGCVSCLEYLGRRGAGPLHLLSSQSPWTTSAYMLQLQRLPKPEVGAALPYPWPLWRSLVQSITHWYMDWGPDLAFHSGQRLALCSDGVRAVHCMGLAALLMTLGRERDWPTLHPLSASPGEAEVAAAFPFEHMVLSPTLPNCCVGRPAKIC